MQQLLNCAATLQVPVKQKEKNRSEYFHKPFIYEISNLYYICFISFVPVLRGIYKNNNNNKKLLSKDGNAKIEQGP